MLQTAATVINGLGLDQQFISREVTEMSAHQLTKTASRSVLGTMNDFAYLADAHRGPRQSTDLIEHCDYPARPAAPDTTATSARTTKSSPARPARPMSSMSPR